MASVRVKKQPGMSPAAAANVNVDAELARLSAANIEDLRTLWRERWGSDAPIAFTKDLIARALAYAMQDQVYGGLDARLRRTLDGPMPGPEQGRHVKVGSVIVREHEGVVHEVLVVPGGFCWQGQVFASLSTIAKRMTGTSWNGPRFFGLRGREGQGVRESRLAADTASPTTKTGRIAAVPSSRVRIPLARQRPRHRGGETAR